MNGHNRPRLVGRGGDRSLYLAPISHVDDWPEQVDEPKPHFIVLLAMDATSVEGIRLAALAKKLLNQGMVYLCAWGPDCGRVHHFFDVALGRCGFEPDDAFVVTDWFDDEDLDDALWYAVTVCPTDAYIESCRAVVAIVVDQSQWSGRVEAAFADFEAFNEAVLAREFPNSPAGERTRS